MSSSKKIDIKPSNDSVEESQKNAKERREKGEFVRGIIPKGDGKVGGASHQLIEVFQVINVQHHAIEFIRLVLPRGLERCGAAHGFIIP